MPPGKIITRSKSDQRRFVGFRIVLAAVAVAVAVGTTLPFGSVSFGLSSKTDLKALVALRLANALRNTSSETRQPLGIVMDKKKKLRLMTKAAVAHPAPALTNHFTQMQAATCPLYEYDCSADNTGPTPGRYMNVSFRIALPEDTTVEFEIEPLTTCPLGRESFGLLKKLPLKPLIWVNAAYAPRKMPRVTLHPAGMLMKRQNVSPRITNVAVAQPNPFLTKNFTQMHVAIWPLYASGCSKLRTSPPPGWYK